MDINSQRVVVAMSGGVDSSVSAALLVEQGSDVMGMMLRLWSEPGQTNTRDNRCCTRDQMLDAHFVARRLGIPFHVVDARSVFKREVVDPFIAGYSRGTTPNPCLACNRQVRFSYLLHQAFAQGATHLATGHYARITRAIDGTYELRRASDSRKDQSYVLSVLTQRQLKHVMFPLGGYTKSEVRKLARHFGLPIASKRESQDLCFVADGNYRRFLRERNAWAFRPGPIVNRAGQVLGQHSGLPDYTIGQRKGLGVSWNEPLYVLEVDAVNNRLVVGPSSELGRDRLSVENINWIAGIPPQEPFRSEVMIRYNAHPYPALVTPTNAHGATIRFDSALRDITPGQGAVFYKHDLVLGGGVISESA